MADDLRKLAEALDRFDAERDGSRPAAPDGIDSALAGYFEGASPSASYLLALDRLAVKSAIPDAPSGKAARSAATHRPPVHSQTVDEVLGRRSAEASFQLQSELGVSRDAATLLLDRPASVLLSYPPLFVARLADKCDVHRGQVFNAIASGLQASGGFVFAYRPGELPDEPASVAVTGQNNGDELLTWGRAFLAADYTKP